MAVTLLGPLILARNIRIEVEPLRKVSYPLGDQKFGWPVVSSYLVWRQVSKRMYQEWVIFQISGIFVITRVSDYERSKQR